MQRACCHLRPWLSSQTLLDAEQCIHEGFNGSTNYTQIWIDDYDAPPVYHWKKTCRMMHIHHWWHLRSFASKETCSVSRWCQFYSFCHIGSRVLKLNGKSNKHFIHNQVLPDVDKWQSIARKHWTEQNTLQCVFNSPKLLWRRTDRRLQMCRKWWSEHPWWPSKRSQFVN